MSQENVELIRYAFGRFQAGDPEWKAFLHPEIEWDFSAYPLADIPTRGQGSEEVISKVIDVWLDYQAEIVEMIESGDDVVVIQHETVRLREADDVLERDIFHVWTIRNGKWVFWRNFPDRTQALEAAGLREKRCNIVPL